MRWWRSIGDPFSAPAYLFIESSGWGDPSNVEEILAAAKEAADKEYDFRGVICLVDVVNFPEQLKDEETAYRQLKHCNLAVLTKTDLADAEQTDAVKKQVRDINPVCEIIESANGQMDYSFMQKDLRIKGVCNLTGQGFTQVDVVGSLIDFKESPEFEMSQLVFISKVGPAVIKDIFAAWETCVGTEMKLRN